MATGRENSSYCKGSKDFDDPVCDPCQEDGELHKAVGMCTDCQDHLCQKCFDGHKITRPFRKHKLVEKEAMDKCTEKCDVHEDKVIEYYCVNHSHLGCSVCKTQDHRTCDSVRYIPHVAKDLTDNEEYQQVKSQLKSVKDRSKKVTEDNKQKTISLVNTCFEAMNSVQKYRKRINKVLDKAEAELLKQCKIIKTDKAEKLRQILAYLTTQQQKVLNFKKETDIIKKSKQNCNLYTLMMKQKNTLKSAEGEIKEAEEQQLHINAQIKFIANTATFISMKIPETLGQLLISGSSSTARSEQTESNGKQEEQTTSITSETLSTTRPEQTESNVRQEEQTTSITSGTLSTARPEQTESNVRQEEQTASITSGTLSTARLEQTESNVRQEEQTASITSGTLSTARLEQTESNVRQEEQTTSITSGTLSTARLEQTESNVRQEEQTASITSGTLSTTRREQTESNVGQEEQTASITSGTLSTTRPEQTESNVGQEEQTASITSGTPSTARPEQTESNVGQEEQTTGITSGTLSTARLEQSVSNVKQEEQTTSFTSGTLSTARLEQTESYVKQEEQTTSITSGTLSTARLEQTESYVKQEEQTTSITSGTLSTARLEQTVSNVKQEEQTTSFTSGTLSTARLEQTESYVKQEEQTTSITSGTLSTARLEQTESNVRQEEQTTSITSGASCTARPEQTERYVKQEEQTTSITSGTLSTARLEQTESNVRQEEQTTSITSGASSTARPEQTESNVRQKERTASITSATPSIARPEQPHIPVRQKEQTASITSGTASTARPEQPDTLSVRQEEQTASITSGTASTARQEQPDTLSVRQEEQTTRMRKAETKRIVRAEHIQDINFNHKNDNVTFSIAGLVVLPDSRLVTTEYSDNSTVKLVDVKCDRVVIACLPLSSAPYDVAIVTNCQVAITIPGCQKVAMVNVTATAMTVDRTLDVDGQCHGVDYRDGKLAVSFLTPHKVQVLTLQGRVLYTITTDQHGHNLFNWPYYVVFGQDNTSLYVSNSFSANVVKVKFDGTVVGTYTDSELFDPMALLTDSSGHVYVCGAASNNIHQITADCRKVQELLTKADCLDWPQSISYSETDCRLYVGMSESDVIKVYRVILGSE